MLSKELVDDRRSVKYTSYAMLAILALVLAGQLVAQLFTIMQLNKVTGKIVAKNVKVTSYASGTRWSAGAPNYSLILTLDNKRSYDVDFTDFNPELDGMVHRGDNATIYYPPAIYNILSLDVLDFGNRVSQVEINGRLLSSFDDHKRKARPFMIFLIIATLPFCYFLYDWDKHH